MKTFKEQIAENKDHPIRKEYDSLKKHDIKTLRNLIKSQHKIVDTSEYKTKDHAISSYLRAKHGDTKVNQAFENTIFDSEEMIENFGPGYSQQRRNSQKKDHFERGDQWKPATLKSKKSQASQAHEYNLDAAQREIDGRHAEGEDMTGAKIHPKTYAIIKPKKVEESKQSYANAKKDANAASEQAATSNSVGDHRKAESAHVSAQYAAKREGDTIAHHYHGLKATHHFKKHNEIDKENKPSLKGTPFSSSDYTHGRTVHKEELELEESVKKVRDNISADQVSKDSNGHIIVRKTFFHRNGGDSGKHADNVKNQLDKVGIKHDIIDHGEIEKTFKGGANAKNSSHWWVKVKLHEESIDEASRFNPDGSPKGPPKATIAFGKEQAFKTALHHFQKHVANDGRKQQFKGTGHGGMPSTDECPSCNSLDIKTYSDGEKECHTCKKTWNVKGMKEATDRFHIVHKDGKPASLASYGDKYTAIKNRNEKHPEANVHKVGPRGKLKSIIAPLSESEICAVCNNEPCVCQISNHINEDTGKHRVQVTISDPSHPMVTKRKELIQKFVHVKANNKDHAIDSAIAHYKKSGYKVHDHNYVGIIEEVEHIDELSTDLLTRYKTAASKASSAANSAKKYELGHKRFKGIIKATLKQFVNDAKK